LRNTLATDTAVRQPPHQQPLSHAAHWWVRVLRCECDVA